MPATERFTYRLGDTARRRVINLSSQAHPMHVYGFYFEVDSLGDGLKDTPIVAADRQPVVTQLMPPATTMTMTWTPERPGSWLLAPRADTAHDHGDHDPSSGMAGMILGVTVLGGVAPRPPEIASAAPPKLTLTMQRHQNGSDQSSFGFALTGDPVPSPSAPVSSPGPLLALRKGELVEITVVNRLGEPTALHWHGMEFDAYYDGVHNWSGIDRTLAPMIMCWRWAAGDEAEALLDLWPTLRDHDESQEANRRGRRGHQADKQAWSSLAIHPVGAGDLQLNDGIPAQRLGDQLQPAEALSLYSSHSSKDHGSFEATVNAPVV